MADIIDTISIASDHGGFSLKQKIMDLLSKKNYQIHDLGCTDENSVDYPAFGYALAQDITSGNSSQGIIICGSGIGISIAANRYSGIRAALCHSVETAKLARQHNDANVLALGARVISQDVALACVETFLTTKAEGGRHAMRVEKLSIKGEKI